MLIFLVFNVVVVKFVTTTGSSLRGSARRGFDFLIIICFCYVTSESGVLGVVFFFVCMLFLFRPLGLHRRFPIRGLL